MVHLVLALVLAAAQAAPPAVGSQLALPSGTHLRQLASPVAPVVAVVPEAARGQVLELHDGWVRVRWRDRTGWVDRRGWAGGAEHADAAQAAETPTVPAEPALDAARRRLGPGLHAGHLGPFDLLTDVEDGALLERLDTMARQLPPLFAERYGLRPGDEAEGADGAGWTVVLFADADDYRALTRHLARTSGRTPEDVAYAGHAVGRLAFLAVQDGVERLFLHEAAHLLLRRTLRQDPPVWLDEGIAGDVEMMPVDSRGRLLGARLRRGALPRHALHRRTGPLARLSDLAEEARERELPEVAALLRLEHRELVRSPRRAEVYALTALFVRYLLEGGGHDLARRFRDHLAAGAEGPLAPALGMDPGELDRGLAGWLVEVETELAVGGR